jgi:hypothetical protein
MEFKKNPELAEKPNHAHYPMCRGRLDKIEDICKDTFYFTILSSAVMGLFSLLMTPMEVVGWIPLMFTLQKTEAFQMSAMFSVVQALMCVVLVVIALLGCFKHKIFTVIMFFVYLMMTLSSLFIWLTSFDIFTLILGAVGVYKSAGILKGYKDYKQLRNTEGFPLFSIILTEYDERKADSPDGYYQDHYQKLLQEKIAKERNLSNSLDASGKKTGKSKLTQFARPSSAETNGLGDMPELNVNTMVNRNVNEAIFKPKGAKEGAFSDSPLKNN